MKEIRKTIEVKVERTIPASPAEVFDAWLSPTTPGTPWNMAEKLLLNPHVDGFFYWLVQGNAHYGRFTKVEGPDRLQHTWMSRSTHAGRGVQRHGDLSSKGRGHIDDACACRPSGH